MLDSYNLNSSRYLPEEALMETMALRELYFQKADATIGLRRTPRTVPLTPCVRCRMNPAPVLPQRPKSHVVGDKAVEIVIAACDPAWVIAPVSKDYGLDLRIEVTRGGYVADGPKFCRAKRENF
jgi:hypothetical protein